MSQISGGRAVVETLIALGARRGFGVPGESFLSILDAFCDFTRISHNDFWKIVDKWYNRDLFEQDRDGIWHPKFKVGTG